MNQGLQAESFWYDFSQDLIRKQDMEKSIIKSADEPNLEYRNHIAIPNSELRELLIGRMTPTSVCLSPGFTSIPLPSF